MNVHHEYTGLQSAEARNKGNNEANQEPQNTQRPLGG